MSLCISGNKAVELKTRILKVFTQNSETQGKVTKHDKYKKKKNVYFSCYIQIIMARTLCDKFKTSMNFITGFTVTCLNA